MGCSSRFAFRARRNSNRKSWSVAFFRSCEWFLRHAHLHRSACNFSRSCHRRRSARTSSTRCLCRSRIPWCHGNQRSPEFLQAWNWLPEHLPRQWCSRAQCTPCSSDCEELCLLSWCADYASSFSLWRLEGRPIFPNRIDYELTSFVPSKSKRNRTSFNPAFRIA
jgi:hypothetical protein